MQQDPGFSRTSPLRPLPNLIFASRWLQLPLYLGLIAAQGVYVVHFLVELWHLIEAAFGNKEALFAEALALYEGREAEQITTALNEAPSARDAIEATLRYNARVYVQDGRPRGCMIVLSLLVGTPDSGPVRELAPARAESLRASLRIGLPVEVAS